MALIVKNFELPDGQILEEAYLKVNTITTSKTDYEFLEPIGDTEDLRVTWVPKLETKVNCYVWADKIARQHQVAPLHWFGFDIDYDLTEWSNIYEQAYSKLKKIYPEGTPD